MRFKRLTAAICALSIALTQTAMLPISAYAADTDSTSFTQTVNEDTNNTEDTPDDNGNDISGGSDDDNDGDGSNNAAPSDDNADDANNTDDMGDGNASDNSYDEYSSDGEDETDAEDIAVDDAHFPDDVFRSYVSEKFDTDNDGVLSDSEISAAQNISIYKKDIKSLKGIEYLTEIGYFYFNNSARITEIDLSQNKKLYSFNVIQCNNLSSITLPEKVYAICIDKCPISELDVTSFQSLSELELVSTNIHSIDISQNAKLNVLEITNTELTNGIDISANTALLYLTVENCGLSSLDISHNTKLTDISIIGSNLTELDLSNHTDLESLDVNNNRLSQLDLSNNPKLESLNVSKNQLSELDLSNNTKLTVLYADKNQLSKLDLSENAAINMVTANHNQLPRIDLSNNTELEILDLSENCLAALDLSKNTKLSGIAASDNIVNIGIVDREYDLRNLSDRGLDIFRMSDISGAKLDNGILYDFKGDTVTYSYDTGKGNVKFTLRAEKVENNGFYVYPDHDSYTNGVNAVRCAAWSDAVKAMTDRNSDYYVALRRDVTEGNITFPSTAKSITLVSDGESEAKTLTIANSNLTLPVNTTLSDVKIESTAARGFTVTAKKDLELIGFCSDTLTALNGTASSKLLLRQHSSNYKPYDISYAISQFGTLSPRGYVIFRKNTNVNELKLNAGSIPYIACTAFTVQNIKASQNAYIGYVGDTISPITINGKVTLDSPDDPIQLIYSFDNDDMITRKYTNGAVLINSKTADVSSFTLRESCRPSEDSFLVRVGSEIKIAEPTFKVSHMNSEKKNINDGEFALWSDVLAVIKDSTADYEIELLGDADIGGALTMPKTGTFGSLMISGGVFSEKTLTFTGNIVLTGETRFYNIGLESTRSGSPTNFTITANYDLYVTSMKSNTLTAVNGSARSSFTSYGNDTAIYPTDVNYGINGFGKVILYGHTVFTNTVKASELVLNSNASIQISDNSVTFGNITANGSTKIIYRGDGIKPMTVTGNISGDPVGIAYYNGENAAKFVSGTTVLTAKTADLSKIKIADESVPEKQSSENYTTARVGSDIKIMAVAFELTHFDKTTMDRISDGTFALWSDVLAKIEETAKTDKTFPYTVSLLADTNVNGALTMPKAGTYGSLNFWGAGRTLTFTGNITLTGRTYFENIKLESQKSSASGVVPANFTITTQYDMNISSLLSDTLTAVNGSSRSTIILIGQQNSYDTVNYAVSGFGTVKIDQGIEFKNTIKTASIYLCLGTKIYTDKNSITAGKITAERGASIVYTSSDLNPVTITGDVVLLDDSSPLKIALADSGSYASYQKFEPNAAVLTAKTADLSKIKIADESVPEKQSSENYTLTRVGSDVKIMAAAFELVHFETPTSKPIEDGTYTLWSDVLAKIAENAKTYKEPEYVVTVLSDADIGGAFTMPRAGTYKLFEIQGKRSGNMPTLKFTGNIILTGNTDFSYIKLESQKKVKNDFEPTNYTITAGNNYTLTVSRLHSDTLTAFNGSARSTLVISSTQVIVPFAVNKFGTVTPCYNVEFKNTVNADVLDLQYAKNLYMGTASMTVKNITNVNGQTINYTTNDFTPLTVTGNITLADGGSQLKAALVDGDSDTYLKFEPNAAVLTAKTADISKIKIADNSVPEKQGSAEYTLARVGSDVKIMPAAFKLTADNGYENTFALWSDVTNTIAANAKSGNKGLDYNITLTANYDMGGPFRMPTANTFGSLSFTGEDAQKTLSFTGNIALTGSTTFRNIRLDSQKKVSNATQSVSFSISAGKNELTLYNTSGDIRSVTSSGDVLLANVTVGTLTANNVYICRMNESGTSLYAMTDSWEGKEVPTTDININGNITVKSVLYFYDNDSSLYVGGVLNAGGISSDNSCTLAVNQQANGKKALIIGKNGFSGSKKISFVLVNAANGKTAEITEDTVLGTITGTYADDLVPSDLSLEEDDSYYIVKENRLLIAKSKTAAEDYVSVSINGKTARYESLDKAVRDISETGKPADEITVYVKSSMFKAPIAKLPLPAAGKYKSITFLSTANICIDLTGDLALTGDLTLKNVSLRKVKAPDKSILPMSVNVGKYTMTMYSGSSLSADENGTDRIANLSGSGKFITGNNTVITGKANIGTLALDLCGIDISGKNASFAGNIEINGTSALKYDKANAANIRLGSIIMNSENDALVLDIDDAAAGDTLASITGDFTANTVKIKDSDLTVVRSGNKLIAINAKNAVTVKNSNDFICVYDTYDNAIADINRINDKNGEYTITLPEGEYAVTRLTLPVKGKYSKLTLTSKAEAVITVKNDIALTGDLTVRGKITLKRADGKTLKITSPKDKNGEPIYKFDAEDEAVVSAIVS